PASTCAEIVPAPEGTFTNVKSPCASVVVVSVPPPTPPTLIVTVEGGAGVTPSAITTCPFTVPELRRETFNVRVLPSPLIVEDAVPLRNPLPRLAVATITPSGTPVIKYMPFESAVVVAVNVPETKVTFAPGSGEPLLVTKPCTVSRPCALISSVNTWSCDAIVPAAIPVRP